MAKKQNHAQGHDHEAGDPNLIAASHVFMSIREQNLELLKLALQASGYANGLPAQKQEMRDALDRTWNLFTEFHGWIDPEQSDDDDDDSAFDE